MSHWAEIDENNIVVRVLVGDNNDPAGDEGYQWLLDNLGGTWIKTSYNNKIRNKYAGKGDTYDPINDVFISPQPYPSWILDKNYKWQPPSPKPDSMCYWDEANLKWVVIETLAE